MLTYCSLVHLLLLTSLALAYPRSLKPTIHLQPKIVKHGYPWVPVLLHMNKSHFMSKFKTLIFLKHMAKKHPKLAPMLAAAPGSSIPAAMDVFNSAVNDLTEIAQSAYPNIGSIPSMSPSYTTINTILTGDSERSSVLQDGTDMIGSLIVTSGGNLGIPAAMRHADIGGINISVDNGGVNGIRYLPNNGDVQVVRTALSNGGSLLELTIPKSNSSHEFTGHHDMSSNNGPIQRSLTADINAYELVRSQDNNNVLISTDNGVGVALKPKTLGTFPLSPFDMDTGGVPVSTKMIKDRSFSVRDTLSLVPLTDTSRGHIDQHVGVSRDFEVKPIGTSTDFTVQPISAEFPISQTGPMDISIRDFKAASLAKDISNPFAVKLANSEKDITSRTSDSHPKLKVYNPFTNQLQQEAFGPGTYHECAPPSRVVCSARIDWGHVIGITSWCKKNCVVFNYSSYCDDNRCQCKCESTIQKQNIM